MTNTLDTKIKIIFFGSSKYSVIDAQALHEAFGLTAIVTVPNKPVGRKQILTPSPVKVFAESQQVLCMTPETLEVNFLEQIKQLQPDFIIVADYGKILPEALLTIPKYASLNVHHSLLPKYRGPSPAPSAILAGEQISGVTIIEMTRKVDAGDILAQETYALKPDETTESLLTELNRLGGNLVVSVISHYLAGTEQKHSQDETQVTLTKRIAKDDAFIDLTNPPSPEQLDRMIRAYYPWPIVWTKWIIENGQGKIIKFYPKDIMQMEGKNPVPLKEFLNGYPELADILHSLRIV